LYNCPVMSSSHGLPSLLAFLTTSVTLAMLWLPPASFYHTTLSETPSGCQYLPSANSILWRVKQVITASGALTLCAAIPVLFSPYFSLSWGICKVADSQSATQEASHKSSFCSELKQKGISPVSHLTPTSSVWMCPVAVGVQRPHISFWGLFLL